MDLCIWKDCADRIMESYTVEGSSFDAMKKTISEGCSNESRAVVNAFCEKGGSDVLGCYRAMQSPGTIILYENACKRYAAELIQKFSVDSIEGIKSVVMAVTISTYMHEFFHFYIDALKHIFPHTSMPVAVEEALATAFEYNFIRGDIAVYSFTKQYYPSAQYFTMFGLKENAKGFEEIAQFENGFWPATKELSVVFGDILAEMPYYSVDNNQNNRGDMWFYHHFRNNYIDQYLGCYSAITATGYKDWSKYNRHYSFMDELQKYFSPIENGSDNRFGIRTDYMLYGILYSLLFSKRIERIENQ